MQDRILAAGLQPTTSAQFVGLLAARRVCTDTSGDERMRKTSTWLLEQGTQTPSPAPDLIPAETRTENSHWDWYSQRGHFRRTGILSRKLQQEKHGRSGHFTRFCAGQSFLSAKNVVRGLHYQVR